MINNFRILIFTIIFILIQLNFLWINNLQAAIAVCIFYIISLGVLTWLWSWHKENYLYLCLITSIILNLCLISWGRLFTLYSSVDSYRYDVFRGVFFKFTGPLYGNVYHFDILVKYWGTLSILWIPAFILGVIFFIYLTLNITTLNRNYIIWNNILFVMFLLSFMYTSGNSAFFEYKSSYQDYSEAAEHFENSIDLFKNYTDLMPELGIHSPHYPPGNALLMKIADQYHWHFFPKFIVLLSCVLSGFPIRALLRKWKFSSLECNISLILLIFCVPVLVFTKTSLDPIFLLFSALSLLLFERIMDKTATIFDSLYFGLVVACFFMFSFISIFVIFFFLCYTILLVWHKEVLIIPIFKKIFISIGVFLFFYIVLYVLTEFNILRCFINSLRHRHSIPGYHAFDDFGRYFFRSTGNLIAFLFTIGSPLIVLIFSGLSGKSLKGPQKLFLITLITTVITASFSGAFFMETERLWIVFVPMVIVISSIQLSRIYSLQKYHVVYGIFILALLHAFIVEFFIDHSLGHFL